MKKTLSVEAFTIYEMDEREVKVLIKSAEIGAHEYTLTIDENYNSVEAIRNNLGGFLSFAKEKCLPLTIDYQKQRFYVHFSYEYDNSLFFLQFSGGYL